MPKKLEGLLTFGNSKRWSKSRAPFVEVSVLVSSTLRATKPGVCGLQWRSEKKWSTCEFGADGLARSGRFFLEMALVIQIP